ncbi:MAG: hypothetical protein Q4C95_11780 [Planctomycetia bacterium]|nr:hypothetical protein [Planctomycetia bacterium]
MKNPVEEIHEIREKIYEETKNMTDEQKEKYLRQSADRVLDQLNQIKRQKDLEPVG